MITFKQIQDWAWRRDNRRYPKKSTVYEAACHFKIPAAKIVEIVGTMGPYFYIVGNGPDATTMFFEHDGE